eukprot:6398714-Lingulodinium_polyedra.AAC.1
MATSDGVSAFDPPLGYWNEAEPRSPAFQEWQRIEGVRARSEEPHLLKAQGPWSAQEHRQG